MSKTEERNWGVARDLMARYGSLSHPPLYFFLGVGGREFKSSTRKLNPLDNLDPHKNIGCTIRDWKAHYKVLGLDLKAGESH